MNGIFQGKKNIVWKTYGNQSLELLEDIKKSICYSSESFVTSTDIKEDCVFDMELHSIAIIADMYEIKLMSLKIVSDNLNLDDYYKNIKRIELENLSSVLGLIENI